MPPPTLTAKSQLGGLVWHVSTAIQELERYVAEQGKIAWRRKKAGLGLATIGRRRRSTGSRPPKRIPYSKVN